MSCHNNCVIVSAKHASSVRQQLKNNGWFDPLWSVKRLPDEKVALPITSEGNAAIKGNNELFNFCDISFEIEEVECTPSKKANLKNPQEKLLQLSLDFVKGKVLQSEDGLVKEVPQKWELHGNLVLFPSTAFTNEVWNTAGFWQSVAECLNVEQVARKNTITDNDFRSPKVTMLFGSDPWIVHVDNGIKCSYDVTKSMFSAGNVSEKLRVANFNCRNETVVDLYAGIGYFTLPYLVHAKASYVHACEWNPAAVEALRRNLKLNHMAERCTVYPDDNRKVCPRGVADRVNLGLIPRSDQGWPVACAALKPTGGILHIHYNVESHLPSHSMPQKIDTEVATQNAEEHIVETKHSELFNNSSDTEHSKTNSYKFQKKKRVIQEWQKWAEEASLRIVSLLEESHPQHKWTTKILHIEHVKSYAPRIDHIVLDLQCSPVRN